jgi:hypothetical protein
MKTSTVILLVGLGLIVVAMVVFLAFLRATVAQAAVVEDEQEVSVETRVRVLDFQGFEQIRTGGFWDLEISFGETYSVELTYPEYLEDGLIAETRGDRLVLDLTRGSRMRAGAPTPRARIRMPELTAFASSGAANVRFGGFESETLTIEIDGGANIEGEDCRIESLRVRASGAAQIDMKQCISTNANVALSGAGSLALTMGGGELIADLSGVTNLTYSGSVSRTKIDRSGVATVTGP